MVEIAQHVQKCLIFIVVSLLRLENIKERWKKIQRYIQNIKNICKLKWPSNSPSNSNSQILVSLLHCLSNSGNSF